MKSRQDAARQAEEIIDTQVIHFMSWIRSLQSISTIRSFREQAEALRDETLARALLQLERGEAPEQVMRELARLLTNKLTHTPSVQIRQASYDGRMDILDVVRELFELSNES